MKLTLELEHNGRTVQRKVRPHSTGMELTQEIFQMVAECERPSLGDVAWNTYRRWYPGTSEPSVDLKSCFDEIARNVVAEAKARGEL